MTTPGLISFVLSTCGYVIGLYLAYRHGFNQGWEGGFNFCSDGFNETLNKLKKGS